MPSYPAAFSENGHRPPAPPPSRRSPRNSVTLTVLSLARRDAHSIPAVPPLCTSVGTPHLPHVRNPARQRSEYYRSALLLCIAKSNYNMSMPCNGQPYELPRCTSRDRLQLSCGAIGRPLWNMIHKVTDVSLPSWVSDVALLQNRLSPSETACECNT
jgi:hypothetical protein